MNTSEDAVVESLQAYFESLFPMDCSNCGRTFETLLEWVSVSHRLGKVISYDAELQDWNTTEPIGSTVLSNCTCGSTLALTTSEMPNAQRLELLSWVKTETDARGITASDLLDHLRDRVRARVLDSISNP